MISVSEAAKIVGLKPAMVRRHCQNGKIKADRVGTYWVIPLDSIRDFQSSWKKFQKKTIDKR